MPAPLPADEIARLATLVGCRVLDSDPDPDLDALVRLAASTCAAPLALITLIDRDRQWFMSRLGVSVRETPREIAFCAYTVLGDQLMVVPDVRIDPRFADNPLVTAEPHIRFYAGAPLVMGGHALGSLCVLDHRPRDIDDAQRTALSVLAREVVVHLELRVARDGQARLARERDLAQARAANGDQPRRLRDEDQQRLRALLDQLPGTVWTVDCELRFTSCAGGRLEQAGLDPTLLLGSDFARLFAGGVGSAAVAAHRSALRGEAQSYELDWRGRSFHCHVQPLRDGAQGPIVGAISVSLDVTAHRRLQAELQQAQKMESVGRLAGGVAHDFNNILTVIIGYAELALHALRPEHAVRPRLEGIQEAAQRAALLTRQLLAFSRKQILHPSALSLNRSVSELAPMLRRMLGEDIRLELALSEPLPAVRADPRQLDQVLFNLAANARDALPRGGRLRIVTALISAPRPGALPEQTPSAARWVELRVEDDGVGMDEATRARVFEPFFTTKEPGKGTGLGLALVYGVIAQSGGATAVESRPGSGTVVAVSLPAIDGPADADPRAARAAGDRGTTGRILLVEDDDALRELVREALEQRGFAVAVARDAVQALRHAEDRAGEFDLVITDIVMPGMSGIDLAAALRERMPALRVIFTSGFSEAAISRYGVLPAGSLISKPYALDELVAQARRALA